MNTAEQLNTTTQPTPEVVAAAQAILAAAATAPTAAMPTSSVIPDEQPQPEAQQDFSADLRVTVEATIDPVKKHLLEDRFQEMINNPRFWAKEKRYHDLMALMVIPVFNDRSLQQFFNHAMADLKSDAAEKSSNTGKPAILPTEEDGKAEAWRRYIVQAKKQITKKLKKDGKAVSEEVVMELLNAELAVLPDKQGE